MSLPAVRVKDEKSAHDEADVMIGTDWKAIRKAGASELSCLALIFFLRVASEDLSQL